MNGQKIMTYIHFTFLTPYRKFNCHRYLDYCMSEEQYQKVAHKSDLQEGGLLKVQVKDKELVLSMVEGKVYAIDNICTHRQRSTERRRT